MICTLTQRNATDLHDNLHTHLLKNSDTLSMLFPVVCLPHVGIRMITKTS